MGKGGGLGGLAGLGQAAGGFAQSFMQATQHQQQLKLQQDRDVRQQQQFDKSLEENKRQMAIADLTRREEMAAQEHRFGLTLAQTQADSAQRDIAHAQELSLKQDENARLSQQFRDTFNVSKEQFDFTKKEADARRQREDISYLDTKAQQGKSTALAERGVALQEKEQKHRETQDFLKPLENLHQAVLTGKIQASQQAQESLLRMQQARESLAPEAVARIAQEWASKGIDPSQAEGQLTDIFATIYGVAHFGAKASESGDPEALSKVEQQLNAAMEQAIQKLQAGDTAGAMAIKENALKAMDSALSGKMTKGSVPALPEDIKAAIQSGLGRKPTTGIEGLARERAREDEPNVVKTADAALKAGVPEDIVDKILSLPKTAERAEALRRARKIISDELIFTKPGVTEHSQKVKDAKKFLEKLGIPTDFRSAK